LAEEAKGVYMSDITVGEHPQLRGHWLDRLPAIDRDVAALEAKLGSAKGETSQGQTKTLMAALAGQPEARMVRCDHKPVQRYHRGQAISLELALARQPATVQLYYRHVNQAERFSKAAMNSEGQRFRAAIPASYTDSAYPLEYYFEVTENGGKAWLYPGFSKQLTNQPYFVN
jgi:hypothetical protein